MASSVHPGWKSPGRLAGKQNGLSNQSVKCCFAGSWAETLERFPPAALFVYLDVPPTQRPFSSLGELEAKGEVSFNIRAKLHVTISRASTGKLGKWSMQEVGARQRFPPRPLDKIWSHYTGVRQLNLPSYCLPLMNMFIMSRSPVVPLTLGIAITLAPELQCLCSSDAVA